MWLVARQAPARAGVRVPPDVGPHARRPRAAVERLEGRVGLGSFQLLGPELEAAVVRFYYGGPGLAAEGPGGDFCRRVEPARGARLEVGADSSQGVGRQGDQCRGGRVLVAAVLRLVHVCSRR